MKLLVRAVLSAACIVSTAVPASACCLWPFGGWWGAGYAPGYGYGPGYPAAGYYAPTVGYYSAGYAGYATSSACCATNCCDPCGSSCGSSCVGTTPSGTLKPSADDKFDRSKYDEELERDREKLRDPAEKLTRQFDDETKTRMMVSVRVEVWVTPIETRRLKPIRWKTPRSH